MSNHVNEALEEAAEKTPLPAGKVLSITRITALLGIILLPLLLIQIYTVTNIRKTVSLHETVGCLIGGVLLAKTITVTAKLIGYYGHRRGFENSHPPLIYRMFSPLFLLITWIIVISGILMVTGHRSDETQVLGISLKTWHGTGWILFLLLLLVHLFGRLIPAFKLVATLWTQTSSTGFARPIAFGLALMSLVAGGIGAVYQHSHKDVWPEYARAAFSTHGRQAPSSQTTATTSTTNVPHVVPAAPPTATAPNSSSVASSGGS